MVGYRQQEGSNSKKDHCLTPYRSASSCLALKLGRLQRLWVPCSPSGSGGPYRSETINGQRGYGKVAYWDSFAEDPHLGPGWHVSLHVPHPYGTRLLSMS